MHFDEPLAPETGALVHPKRLCVSRGCDHPCPVDTPTMQFLQCRLLRASRRRRRPVHAPQPPRRGSRRLAGPRDPLDPRSARSPRPAAAPGALRGQPRERQSSRRAAGTPDRHDACPRSTATNPMTPSSSSDTRTNARLDCDEMSVQAAESAGPERRQETRAGSDPYGDSPLRLRRRGWRRASARNGTEA